MAADDPANWRPPRPLTGPNVVQWQGAGGPPYKMSTFKHQGTLGPSSWDEVQARVAAAFQSLGINVSGVASPLYGAGSIWGGPSPGYGAIVGERNLQIGLRGWFKDYYTSFVVWAQFWVDPPPPKHFEDRADLPHVWKVAVSAGQVLSYPDGPRGDRPWRFFYKTAPESPGNESVAGAFFSCLMNR